MYEVGNPDNGNGFIYARITIYSEKLSNCTLDWQRYNNEWISLYSGTLEECLNKLDANDNWF